jgi:RND family efflux transporter MFP subunit
MKSAVRWILTLVVIGGLIAAGFWAWENWGQSAPPSDDPALVTTAERRDIEANLLLTGEVTPAYKSDIKSEVGGKIRKIHVQVGDFVKKGGLLVTIDDTDLLTEKRSAETDIEGAELAVEKNRGNFERAESLYKQKLISKEVYDNLKADLDISINTLEKAKSRLQIVLDKLAKTKITAPADGTVLEIPVTEGLVVVAAASVNSGTILMTFADLSQLLIESHVNQVDAPRLTRGQEVEVNMSDSNEAPVKARIEFIAPLAVVKNNIKGFQVKALIEDTEGRLKPGMSVSMNVPIGSARQAVSVPVSAVFKERKQNVVYVRKADGLTEKRKVTVGVNNLSYVEIKSGLKEGEEIFLVEPNSTPAKS